MKNYIETFLRRPFLFLLPAVLVPSVAAVSMAMLPPQYQAEATLQLKDEGVATTPGQSSLVTPAMVEARAFNEKLSTAAFRDRVLTEAGLLPSIQDRSWPSPQPPAAWLAGLPGLSLIGTKLGGAPAGGDAEALERAHETLFASVTASGAGRGLVTIAYEGPDADLGRRLVEAAVTVFRAEKLALAQSLANEAVRFHDAEIARLEGVFNQSRTAYLEYAATLPSGTVTQTQTIAGVTSTVTSLPSTAQAQQLADLQRRYDDARTRLQDAQATRDNARVTALAAYAAKADNLTLVDPARAPAAPTSGLKMLVAVTFMAALLGVALASALTMVATWLDRVVRRPEDVTETLDAEVVGIIPFVARDRRSA